MVGCGFEGAGRHAPAWPLDRGDSAWSATGSDRGPGQGGGGRPSLPAEGLHGVAEPATTASALSAIWAGGVEFADRLDHAAPRMGESPMAPLSAKTAPMK